MIQIDSHDYRHFTCGGCGYSFDAPVSCGNRFCEICTGSRRRKIRYKLNAIIDQIVETDGYGIKFLTLTIPNQKDLKNATVQILKSFRRLRQRRFWLNKVNGGAWIIEVTGQPGKWHVHLHCLLEARYIPHSLLAKRWASVSPGRIVYIQKIPRSAVIRYVTKYVSKGETASPHSLQISDALKNVRLFQPFGCWQKIALSLPKIAFSCPTCGYTGFYLNQAGFDAEKFGARPCRGTLEHRNRRKVVLKHGTPVHPRGFKLPA